MSLPHGAVGWSAVSDCHFALLNFKTHAVSTFCKLYIYNRINEPVLEISNNVAF